MYAPAEGRGRVLDAVDTRSGVRLTIRLPRAVGIAGLAIGDRRLYVTSGFSVVWAAQLPKRYWSEPVGH